MKKWGGVGMKWEGGGLAGKVGKLFIEFVRNGGEVVVEEGGDEEEVGGLGCVR